MRPYELEHIEEAGRWVRRVFVVVVCVTLPFFTGISMTERLVLLGLALAFGVAAEIFDALARRNPRFPAFYANAYLGLILIFVTVLVAPELHGAGLFAFALAIALFPAVGGYRTYVPVTLTAVGLSLIAEARVPAEIRFSAITMVAFVCFAVTLAVLVDVVVRQLRGTSDQLERLRAAIGTVTATPDLDETLDSMADSISEIFQASTTGVMLREEDHLVVAAPRGIKAQFEPSTVASYTRRELARGEASPLAACMTHKAPVVVESIPDPRFPAWNEMWQKPMHDYGLRSLVAVPLCADGVPFGSLILCFPETGAMSEEDLDLLEVYADQAALVILRAQAYEREKTAAEQIQEADRLKTEFLAMVSHELRTPLTSVKGWVDTVLLRWDRFDDDRRRQLLSRASTNADELTRLVDQLLDFSKIEAGRVELRPQVLPLRSAIEGITNDLLPALGDRELILDINGTSAVADVNAFNHILVNLLTNAIKFSPAGSAVTVSTEEQGDEVVVAVTDEGCGIPAEDLDRVFERFYQSAGPVMSRRGTGIGLAIAYRFVDLHGGRIWVESTVGEGSTFFFTLPSAGPESGVDTAQAS